MSPLDAHVWLDGNSEGLLDHDEARTLASFAALLALRDAPTAGHCRRVARAAGALGRELGLDPTSVEALRLSGLLHDLGKIRVPGRILSKPGALSRGELRQVRQHADLGADLVGAVSPALGTIADAVRSHHESWDGTGYPRGLRRRDIPLFGRILAVVDNFEALTALRPYREPLPSEEALARLRRHAGTRFDPQVVRDFEAAWAAGRVRFDREGPRPLAALPVSEPPRRWTATGPTGSPWPGVGPWLPHTVDERPAPPAGSVP